MIPIIVYVALLIAMVPLFIYAFLDTRNKYYANIIAAFLVSIICAYLSVVISIGIVQYDPVVTFNGTFTTNESTCLQWETINQTRECIEYNNYTAVHNICYNCTGVPVTDASFGYIMLIISVIMMIYTIVMVFEAYNEHKLEKENE